MPSVEAYLRDTESFFERPLVRVGLLALALVALAFAAALMTGCQFSYDDSASSGLKAGASMLAPANPCDDGACAAPDKP